MQFKGSHKIWSTFVPITILIVRNINGKISGDFLARRLYEIVNLSERKYLTHSLP